MIQFNTPLRARVLSVEEDHAVLGVYVHGQWHRVPARVQGIRLCVREWINGTLKHGPDGTIVFSGTRHEGSE